jgi:hypothetical protein
LAHKTIKNPRWLVLPNAGGTSPKVKPQAASTIRSLRDECADQVVGVVKSFTAPVTAAE